MFNAHAIFKQFGKGLEYDCYLNTV